MRNYHQCSPNDGLFCKLCVSNGQVDHTRRTPACCILYSVYYRDSTTNNGPVLAPIRSRKLLILSDY